MRQKNRISEVTNLKRDTHYVLPTYYILPLTTYILDTHANRDLIVSHLKIIANMRSATVLFIVFALIVTTYATEEEDEEKEQLSQGT